MTNQLILWIFCLCIFSVTIFCIYNVKRKNMYLKFLKQYYDLLTSESYPIYYVQEKSAEIQAVRWLIAYYQGETEFDIYEYIHILMDKKPKSGWDIRYINVILNWSKDKTL